jgi:hypothetical protein
MGHSSDGDREDSKDNKEKYGPLADASTRQAYAINEPANSTLLTPCEGTVSQLCSGVTQVAEHTPKRRSMTECNRLSTRDLFERLGNLGWRAAGKVRQLGKLYSSRLSEGDRSSVSAPYNVAAATEISRRRRHCLDRTKQ